MAGLSRGAFPRVKAQKADGRRGARVTITRAPLSSCPGSAARGALPDVHCFRRGGRLTGGAREGLGELGQVGERAEDAEPGGRVRVGRDA